MFTQAIASSFSTYGTIFPRYSSSKTISTELKVDAGSLFKEEAATVEISELGRMAIEEHQGAGKNKEYGQDPNENASKENDLDEEEIKEVEKLKQRDREVRQHEQAHVAAGGGVVKGGPKYEFQTGPDNQQYAVGGHVSIDSGPVAGNPQATIQKAQTIRRAALAPADPSGTDRQVAASAGKMEREARMEKQKEAMEGTDAGSKDADKAQGISSESAPAVTGIQKLSFAYGMSVRPPSGSYINLLA